MLESVQCIFYSSNVRLIDVVAVPVKVEIYRINILPHTEPYMG